MSYYSNVFYSVNRFFDIMSKKFVYASKLEVAERIVPPAPQACCLLAIVDLSALTLKLVIVSLIEAEATRRSWVVASRHTHEGRQEVLGLDLLHLL